MVQAQCHAQREQCHPEPAHTTTRDTQPDTRSRQESPQKPTHTPIKWWKNVRGEPTTVTQEPALTNTGDPTHTQTPDTKNTQTPRFRRTAHTHRFTYVEIYKTDIAFIQ